jgi:ParB-like nuclease domain
MPLRSRIKAHRKVRVGDLVPHELNPRTHSTEQRRALRSLIGDLGFARSILVYELPDGRLKIIDGHLRQSELRPDDQVDVEILDVSDDEARALLLSIDPLAQLAGYDGHALDQLRERTQTATTALATLWDAVERSQQATQAALNRSATAPAGRPQQLRRQYWLMIECADERELDRLLDRFQGEGLRCQAKIS